MSPRRDDKDEPRGTRAGRQTVESYPGEEPPQNPYTRLQTQIADTNTREAGTRPQATILEGSRTPSRKLTEKDADKTSNKTAEPASREPSLVGETVGNYRIKKLLGRGGMGRVYLAEHIKLGREVALKLLRPHYAKRRDSVNRFFQEARAVNQIRHRNIVDISDFVELPNGRSFIIMALLHGHTLGELHRKQGALSFERLCHLFAQICDALDAAHRHGFVHRDLKPENIFVLNTPEEPDGIRILDFGVAKLLSSAGTESSPDGDSVQTAAGTIVGTPAYMSPEQASAEPVDARTDIYSVGAILYELLAGRPLFSAQTFREYAQKHLHEPPIPLRTIPNGRRISEALDELVLRCLAKQREDRFGSMGELRDALIRAMAHEQQIEQQLASHGGEVLLPGAEGRPLTLERPAVDPRLEWHNPPRGVVRNAKPTPGVGRPVARFEAPRRAGFGLGEVLRQGAIWLIIAMVVGALGAVGWRMAGRIASPSPSDSELAVGPLDDTDGGRDLRRTGARAILSDDYRLVRRGAEAALQRHEQKDSTMSLAERALGAQLWLVRAQRFGDPVESARRNARSLLPQLAVPSRDLEEQQEPTVLEALALDDLLAGETARAAERSGRALALAPGDALSLLYDGWTHAARGQDKQALELYERALVAEPAATAALFSELRLATARGDATASDRLSARLTKLAPDHVGARLLEARRATGDARRATAGTVLIPALASTNGSPAERVEVLLRLSEHRRASGELAEAGAYLDEALRLQPQAPEARLARARLWLAQGELSKSEKLLSGLAKERGLTPELAFELLLARVELAVVAHRPFDAQAQIAQLSLAQQQDPRAEYWSARVTEEAGDPVEGPKAAMKVYQRLMRGPSPKPEPFVRYAALALARGDRRAARSALEQARKLFGSDPAVVASLADLQQLAGPASSASGGAPGHPSDANGRPPVRAR